MIALFPKSKYYDEMETSLESPGEEPDSPVSVNFISF